MEQRLEHRRPSFDPRSQHHRSQASALAKARADQHRNRSMHTVFPDHASGSAYAVDGETSPFHRRPHKKMSRCENLKKRHSLTSSAAMSAGPTSPKLTASVSYNKGFYDPNLVRRHDSMGVMAYGIQQNVNKINIKPSQDNACQSYPNSPVLPRKNENQEIQQSVPKPEVVF